MFLDPDLRLAMSVNRQRFFSERENDGCRGSRGVGGMCWVGLIPGRDWASRDSVVRDHEGLLVGPGIGMKVPR